MIGKNWYFTVNEYCLHVAEAFDIPMIKVAGILAALSPNNKFDKNCIDLENFILTGGNCKVSTYNSNKEKAAKILNLSVLEANEESIKDILKGMKTVSFFENIFRPHTSEAVTVDLWQIRWAKLLNILPKQGALTPKRYNKVVARVRKYAKKLDIMPHQFQAVTWVALRGRAW